MADVVSAARDVRPRLADLVGPGWEDLDAQLDALLTRADRGEAVDVEIVDALRTHDATRRWLRDALGPFEQTRGFQPAPGESDVVSVMLFECPEGDYRWRRRDVGVPIPLCPTHRVRLVSVSRAD